MNVKKRELRAELGEAPRSGLDRRTVLGAAGGAALVVGWAPASMALAAQDWQPAVFDAKQGPVVQRLVEAILPRTDTPGAADALVDRMIDLQLSLDNDAGRARFFEGLSSLEALASKRFSKRLPRLDDDQLSQLLQLVSGDAEPAAERGSELARARRFFDDLKQRTVDAYYTSRPGWVEELGMPDGPFTSRYRGCAHTDSDHSKA